MHFLHLFEIETHFVKVFTVTSDQFNGSLWIEVLLTDLKPFNGRVFLLLIFVGRLTKLTSGGIKCVFSKSPNVPSVEEAPIYHIICRLKYNVLLFLFIACRHPCCNSHYPWRWDLWPQPADLQDPSRLPWPTLPTLPPGVCGKHTQHSGRPRPPTLLPAGG